MKKCYIKKNKLKTLCETCWVERHDALITFKELFMYLNYRSFRRLKITVVNQIH